MQKIKIVNRSNLTLEEALELFLRKCQIRNLSPNTIKFYREKAKIYFQFEPKTNNVSYTTPEKLEDFVLWLQNNRNISETTLNSYLRGIRGFFYFCMKEGYIKSFKIELVKEEKKIKETYTDEELLALLLKPDLNKCSFAEYKTWVFINYLVGTGSRISSALALQIKNLDFNSNTIVLKKTKNRRQQIIPLSTTLAQILIEYLQIRKGEPDDYVFCNDYGQQGKRRSYQQLVQRYNLNRGVKKTSCHLFRHTFAKNWIIAGGDVFRLQKILGHRDLTITREYVNMFGQDLMLDFEKFNSLDRLSKPMCKIKM